MKNNNLDKYKYISFDIFDTLIKRNIDKPSDVFILVKNKYNEMYNINLKDYPQNRIMAERTCRLIQKKDEVTLDMIYEKLVDIYGKEECETLKKLEEKVEIDVTQKTNNEEVLNIYNKYQKNGNIIIISDMYLPKNVVEKILEKNNIKYKKLYLSCEVNKKKSTAELFKYVLNDLNIESSEMIHIGDHKISDYEMPKSLGIDAIKIPRKIDNLNYENKYVEKEIHENINYNMLYNFTNNNITGDDYFYRFGYSTFGPLLLGFSKWLISNFNEKHISKIFFLARDGKIMKEAFDIIDTEGKFKTSYFMASRRSIIVPSLHMYPSIDDMLKNIQIPKNVTINDLLKRLGLDDIEPSSILKKYDLIIDKKYKYDDLINTKKDFLNELYPIIIENSKKEYDAILNYSKKMDFDNKVAVVDIGWYGNMQKAMTKLFDNEIIGFYLGLRQNKKDGIETFGYLFDKNKNPDIDKKQFGFNSLFEFIFSATHGSVKRFVNSDTMYELYESENMNDYEFNALSKIQSGAIEFIKNYTNSNMDDYIKFDEKICVYNIFSILCYPNYIDSKKIGDIQFKDGEIKYLAHSLGLKNYIKSPKKMIKDLKNSLWKVGFLKRTFKVNGPYYTIYNFIKKISR